jgi:GT2 family glycosyltransferase
MISIIIVSYNTKKYTRDCIESLYERVKTKFELVVVDNNSTDGSRELLTRYSKKYSFKLLTLDENIGFGRANNEGAKVAKGNWLFFLNSDTIVKNDVISGLTRKTLKDKTFGAAGIRLVGSDGVIQSNGGYSPRWWRVLSWMTFMDDLPILNRFFSPIHPKKSVYTASKELDWVTGAALLVKAKYFEKVGGFDPKIFMYCEDMDLCLGIKKLGKRILYFSDLYVIHYGGKSSSNENALYMEAITMPYVVGKHFGSVEKTLASIFIKLGALLRLFIFGIIFYDEAKNRAYKKILA